MASEFVAQKPIALVGFMGSGKTEVGRIIAASLGVEFQDLDEWIEASAGATVSALFSTLGEEGFRKLEHRALTAAADWGRPFVLSCGGGIVGLETNRHLLKERFRTVWLDVPDQELESRLEGCRAGRPLLADDRWRERIRELCEKRRPWYGEVARLRHLWCPGEGPEDSARLVLEALDVATLG